jgi:hypothetical protein
MAAPPPSLILVSGGMGGGESKRKYKMQQEIPVYIYATTEDTAANISRIWRDINYISPPSHASTNKNCQAKEMGKTWEINGGNW